VSSGGSGKNVSGEVFLCEGTVLVQSHLVITKAKSSDFSFRYNEIPLQRIILEMPKNVSKPRGKEKGIILEMQ